MDFELLNFLAGFELLEKLEGSGCGSGLVLCKIWGGGVFKETLRPPGQLLGLEMD